MIYLYAKQHTVTGLKYFGMTRSNPFKYQGSGKYWKRHITKHGKENVKTLEIWGFDDQKLCTEFALKFSKDNNIVESKEWANLQEENGLDGTTSGSKFIVTVSRVGSSNNFYGKSHNQETKDKISKSKLGKKSSDETRAKLRISNKNRIVTDDVRTRTSITLKNKPLETCPHCQKTGRGSAMIRWHFDNCRSKEVI